MNELSKLRCSSQACVVDIWYSSFRRENGVLAISSKEEVGESGFEPTSLCLSTTLRYIWWAHDSMNQGAKC